MSPRPLERTLGLVVRLADSGESDRIVGLFTRSSGLIAAIAKSARRSTKRFGGSLQTGQLLEVELVRSGHGLPRLESARIADAHLGLLQDLARLDEAAVVLRALRDHVPEGEPDADTFDDACLHLRELAAGGASPVRLVAFRLRLLDRLGVGPELESCVRCGKSAGAHAAYVEPRHGGLVCRACGGAGLVIRPDSRELARRIRRGDAPDPDDSASIEPALRLAEVLDAVALHHLASRGRRGP